MEKKTCSTFVALKDAEFSAPCRSCGEEVPVHPNTHLRDGVEGDFWCCGQRQWASWYFANGHGWEDAVTGFEWPRR